MKSNPVSVLLFSVLLLYPSKKKMVVPVSLPTHKVACNLVLVTLDGFRWQEVFDGADSLLLFNEHDTAPSKTGTQLYWDPNPEQRRKKLLPFFWNVLAREGQLYGNRNYDNCMNTANDYAISYPGYNELLAASIDERINSNEGIENPNLNLLEYLSARNGFDNKVAAFTSWNLFPYILSTGRNKLYLDSGPTDGEPAGISAATRNDSSTFCAALTYATQHHPRFLFIGLGETDEYAHAKRYERYLERACFADRQLSLLWQWIQHTPAYRDQTILVITTDHGRGNRKHSWSKHGVLISGSSQTWMGIIGPGVNPFGEMRTSQQLYLQQLAPLMAQWLGENFTPARATP